MMANRTTERYTSVGTQPTCYRLAVVQQHCRRTAAIKQHCTALQSAPANVVTTDCSRDTGFNSSRSLQTVAGSSGGGFVASIGDAIVSGQCHRTSVVTCREMTSRLDDATTCCHGSETTTASQYIHHMYNTKTNFSSSSCTAVPSQEKAILRPCRLGSDPCRPSRDKMSSQQQLSRRRHGHQKEQTTSPTTDHHRLVTVAASTVANCSSTSDGFMYSGRPATDFTCDVQVMTAMGVSRATCSDDVTGQTSTTALRRREPCSREQIVRRGGGGVEEINDRSGTTRRIGSLWIGRAIVSQLRHAVVTAAMQNSPMPTSASKGELSKCPQCCRNVTSRDRCCLVLNRLYHVSCLTCCVCKRKMCGKTFYCANEQIFCESDYRYVGFRMNAENCATCHDVITDKLVQALGKCYHPQCFNCALCGLSLHNIPFTVDIYSRPHCLDDYVRMYGPKCSVCRHPVCPTQGSTQVRRIVALDRTFHETCFRCTDCDTSLVGNADSNSLCFPLDDVILCLHCNIRRRLTQQQQHYQNLSSVSHLVTHHVPVSSPPPPPYGNNPTWRLPVSSATAANHDVIISCGVDAVSDVIERPLVDVTVDDDASCCGSTSSSSYDVIDAGTTAATDDDDVSAAADDDVTAVGMDDEKQNCAYSVDSGHGSSCATSDDTVTSSSDTDTIDAASAGCGSTSGGDSELEEDEEVEREVGDGSYCCRRLDVVCRGSSATDYSHNTTQQLQPSVIDFIAQHLNCSDLTRVTDL